MTRINVTDWLQRLFESKPPRRQSGCRWAATNPLPNCPAEQLEERIVFSTSTLAAAIVPLAERTGPVIRVVEVVEVAEVIDGQPTAVDFGSTIQRSSGMTRLFTVTNRGTSNLNLGRVSVPRGFELTEPLSTRG